MAKGTGNKKIIILVSILLVSVGIAVTLFMYQKSQVPLDVLGKIEPFQLQRETGEEYNSDNGKIKLITFFLINCPDGVCPLTMVDFADLQEELKKKHVFGSEVELIAITFDPERDQVEDIREYAAHFNADPDGWKFLRGSEEEIATLSSQLNYFYMIHEDGSAVHTTIMYLVDEEHQIRAYHRMTTSSEAMDKEGILNDIKLLLKE